MKKDFTFKEVVAIIFFLIAGFSFLETSAPILTIAFLREFLLKFIGYCVAAEIILVFWETLKNRKN
jgi:hypothetical protein